MENERYIQVGYTAMREPGTGAFLPAVPLYIRDENGAGKAAEELTGDIAHLLALRMKQYVDGCRAAGISDQ